MMDFVIRIANKNIGIHSVYPNAYKACKDYLIDDDVQPDIEIRTNEAMILAEVDRDLHSSQNLSLKNIEALLVHRLIAEALLDNDTFLMHGAVVAMNGTAYMFTAKSGTGKSTHVQSWLGSITGAYVVNGDKPFIIVRETGELPLACGSPWAGKENLQTNTMVPLKAIVLLERAEDNRMERISSAKAFPFLVQQVYRPDDEGKMRKTLRLMQRMNATVSFWRFQCNNFKDDCFDVAYNALVKGQV